MQYHLTSMPDIDPAALTRSDTFVQPLAPSALSTKLNGINTLSAQKAVKASNAVQRIDLEPFYTSLKAAIGDHWSEYKEGISLFVLGMVPGDRRALDFETFTNLSSFPKVNSTRMSSLFGLTIS